MRLMVIILCLMSNSIYANDLNMTNTKAHTLCETIVNKLNSGELPKSVQPLKNITDEKTKQLKTEYPDLADELYTDSLYLNEMLDIEINGEKHTLVRLMGNGTCHSSLIYDLNAKKRVLHTNDPESVEGFDGNNWGEADYFLHINNEPIIASGNLLRGESEISLVSWLDEHGTKIALCKLEKDSAQKPKIIDVTKNGEDPVLCEKTLRNQVAYIAWNNSELKISNIYRESDYLSNISIDINLDGGKETISLFDYSSGAGCGSSGNFIREIDNNTSTIIDSGLNKIIEEAQVGNEIKNNVLDDVWYTPKFFNYQNKPYILSGGQETSAEVTSLWGNKKKTWCQYQTLPQYKIKKMFPIETWAN